MAHLPLVPCHLPLDQVEDFISCRRGSSGDLAAEPSQLELMDYFDGLGIL